MTSKQSGQATKYAENITHISGQVNDISIRLCMNTSHSLDD